MVVNLSIVVYDLSLHMLILLSIDEILQPKYTNCLTDFKDLPFNEKMVLLCVCVDLVWFGFMV